MKETDIKDNIFRPGRFILNTKNGEFYRIYRVFMKDYQMYISAYDFSISTMICFPYHQIDVLNGYIVATEV